ncbi:MAG TPA: hypothetical protein VJA40_01970 [archaeon]|nr:hypothetical protein [archaeon]
MAAQKSAPAQSNRNKLNRNPVTRRALNLFRIHGAPVLERARRVARDFLESGLAEASRPEGASEKEYYYARVLDAPDKSERHFFIERRVNGRTFRVKGIAVPKKPGSQGVSLKKWVVRDVKSEEESHFEQKLVRKVAELSFPVESEETGEKFPPTAKVSLIRLTPANKTFRHEWREASFSRTPDGVRVKFIARKGGN